VDGTRTTSTRTQSTCDTIRGCRVDDDDWETTTTKSCTRIENRGFATAETSPTPTSEPLLQARAGKSTCITDDIVIYPQDYRILPPLQALLDSPIGPSDPGRTWRDKSTVVGAGGEDEFVAFIYIPDVERQTWLQWDVDMDYHVSAGNEKYALSLTRALLTWIPRRFDVDVGDQFHLFAPGAYQ
jgi:hypothetical protein